jgi:hypothetical protein
MPEQLTVGKGDDGANARSFYHAVHVHEKLAVEWFQREVNRLIGVARGINPPAIRQYLSLSVYFPKF